METKETRTTNEQGKTQTPEQNPAEKVSLLQAEILDDLYKAQEIGKALDYLLTCPPEYKNFDPCFLAQSILDYLKKIEQKVSSLTFKG